MVLKSMFFKFTEIWYKGALLNADYGVDVKFFEATVIYIFWGQISVRDMIKNVDHIPNFLELFDCKVQ